MTPDPRGYPRRSALDPVTAPVLPHRGSPYWNPIADALNRLENKRRAVVRPKKKNPGISSCSAALELLNSIASKRDPKS